MKTIKPTTISILTVLMILCIATFSSAASYGLGAEAASVIDWGMVSFNFSGVGGVTGAEFEAAAEMNAKPFYTDPLDAYHETVTGYAWGETDVNESGFTDYQDLYAGAGTFVPPSFEYGYADAGYYGQFQAGSAGTLTISMDYFFYIYTKAGVGQQAYADAGVMIYLGDEHVADSLFYCAFNMDDYEYETPWQTLELSVNLAAGQTIDFELMASAYAEADPVPVPGAFWLLSSGIIGIAGLKRLKI